MLNNKELEYLEKNTNLIFNNFALIFDVEHKEFKLLIRRLLESIYKEQFFIEQLKNRTINLFFEEKNLIAIKNYLSTLGLNNYQIKMIILTSPQILLFSERIDDIYPIFKNKHYKGYALLNNNEYISYSNFDDYEKALNIIELNNEFNYIVDKMLLRLNREDVLNELSINAPVEIKDKFKILTKNYSRKNYYFKK